MDALLTNMVAANVRAVSVRFIRTTPLASWATTFAMCRPSISFTSQHTMFHSSWPTTLIIPRSSPQAPSLHGAYLRL